MFTGNILRQPMMKNQKYKKALKKYINADNVMENGVLLPLHHGLNTSMIDQLHNTIKKFIKKIPEI